MTGVRDSHFARARRDVERHFGCYLGYLAFAVGFPGLLYDGNAHAALWCCLALLWNATAHRTARDFYEVSDIAERALDAQERSLNFSYEQAMKTAKQYGLPTRFPL